MGREHFAKLVIKFLGGCLLAFTLIMTLLWSLLNSQSVHQLALHFTNQYFLNPQGIHLNLNRVIFNPFNMDFSIDRLAVQWGEIALSTGKHQGRLEISRTQISLDFLRSYARKRLFLHNFTLDGIKINLSSNAQGEIILPEFFRNQETSTNADPSLFSASPLFLFQHFPSRTDIRNITIVLTQGKKIIENKSKNDQIFSLENMLLSKIPRENRAKTPSVSVKMSGLKTPFADLKKLEGFLFLGHTFEESSYKLQVTNLDIAADTALPLVDLSGQGQVQINGIAKAASWSTIPTFQGHVAWQNLQIDQFAVYQGNTDILFQNKTIFYSNAQVQPYSSALVTAFGFYQFFEEFYFENYGILNNFSFKELLNGLGVPDSPIEFPITSKNVVVSGKIMPTQKDQHHPKKFELWARADAHIGSPHVQGFSSQEPKQLPTGIVNLKLYVINTGLDFNGTHMTLHPKGHLQLKKGFIDLTPIHGIAADFSFSGEDIDLSGVEYFLHTPISGKANLSGVLKATPDGDINFQAQTKLPSGGSIADIQFQQAELTWGIGLTNFWLKDGWVLFEKITDASVRKTAQLKINNFDYNFDSENLSILTAISGELSALASGMQKKIPDIFLSEYILGNIENFTLEFRAPWHTPEKGSLQASGHVKNIYLMSGQISSLNLNISCKYGLCEDSFIIADQVQSRKRSTSERDPALHAGWLKLNLSKLSSNDNAMTITTVRMPVGAFSTLPTQNPTVEGTLFADLTLFGSWNALTVKGQLGVTESKISEIYIGNLASTFVWSTKQKEFSLEALSGNLKLQYQGTPNNEEDQLSIIFQKLDIARFLPVKILEEQDIYSNLTGYFSLKGKTLINALTNSQQFQWNTLKGEGILNEASIFWGPLIFQKQEKSPTISIAHGKLNLADWALRGSLGHAELFGSVLLPKEKSWNSDNFKWSLKSEVNIVLEPLKKLFPDVFQEIQGKIQGILSIENSIKKYQEDDRPTTSDAEDHTIRGELTWDIPQIDFVGVGKPLENIQGHASLEDSLITIDKFTINTRQPGGQQGALTIGGRMDFFSSLFSPANSNLQLASGYWPTMAIDIRAKNFPTRIPVPLFEISDVVFDTEVSISGNNPPYKLEGRIDLLDVQLFRDATCEQLVASALNRPKSILNDYMNMQNTTPLLNLDVRLYSAGSVRVQSRCLRGKFSLYPFLEITGSLENPLLSGTILTDNASLQLLKGRFLVRKGEVEFTSLNSNDPNLDIQMEARIAEYTVFGNVFGRLSTAQISLFADPPNLGNGDTITQGDIVAMVSSGFVPTQSSPTNVLAASTSLTGFLGIDNSFEATLNQTVSQVTLGVIDSVTIAPATQNGQLSWQVTAVRSLSERLSLGISYETGDYGVSRMAYTNYLLNNVASFFGGYDYNAFAQQPVTSEFSGGLRFRFGGQ